jgi:hypothetical protein
MTTVSIDKTRVDARLADVGVRFAPSEKKQLPRVGVKTF